MITEVQQNCCCKRRGGGRQLLRQWWDGRLIIAATIKDLLAAVPVKKELCTVFRWIYWDNNILFCFKVAVILLVIKCGRYPYWKNIMIKVKVCLILLTFECTECSYSRDWSYTFYLDSKSIYNSCEECLLCISPRYGIE